MKINQVWVSFTKSGPIGIQGPYGPPGKVIVSDNPPMQYPAVGEDEARDLEEGDLWFDSYHVLLYVYYLDEHGPGQWVAVSKTGPKGDSGDQGEPGDPTALLFENPLALDVDSQTVTFEIDNLLSI